MIGSLFSGIGGLELGLERAGCGAPAWQVESDQWCRAVLAKHWPDADRSVTDVRRAGSHNLAHVDVICGGFPCQDVSVAGAGAGLDGARSGLWWEFIRIIRDLRPRVVAVENVSALLIRGLDAVLGSLASSGYDAEWDCIPAQAVGAPHRRDRVFVVAWRVSDAVSDRLRHEPERGQGAAQTSDGGDAEPDNVGSDVVADTDDQRREEQQHTAEPRAPGRGGIGHNWPPGPDNMHAWQALPLAAQPAICREAHGVPRGLDRRRLSALGNAVVPQVAEVVGRRVCELLRGNNAPKSLIWPT